jgi:hypothetical protein
MLQHTHVPECISLSHAYSICAGMKLKLLISNKNYLVSHELLQFCKGMKINFEDRITIFLNETIFHRFVASYFMPAHIEYACDREIHSGTCVCWSITSYCWDPGVGSYFKWCRCYECNPSKGSYCIDLAILKNRVIISLCSCRFLLYRTAVAWLLY